MGHTHEDKPFSTAPVVYTVLVSVLLIVAFCELFPAAALAVFETFTITKVDMYLILGFAVGFLFIWKLLDTFLFAPYLALYDAREQATAGADEEADALREKASKITADFEQSLFQARVEAMQGKLKATQEAAKEGSAIVAQAEDAAAAQIAAARTELQESISELREEAFRDADSMIQDVVDRLKQPAAPVGGRTH